MSVRAQQGVSIVEIMVALTIGLFLTAGIVQLFISSKQTYRAQEGFARLQENGRYALDVMARALRGHGNLGCIAMAGVTGEEGFEIVTEGDSSKALWGRLNVLAKDLADADDVLTDLDVLTDYVAPMGYQEGSTSGNTRKLVLPADSSIAWVTGTDALVLSGVYGRGTYLGADMTAWDEELVLANNNQGFKAGDLLLITDCANVDIFQVSAVAEAGKTIKHDKVVTAGSATGNRSDQLSTVYRKDSPSSINAMVFPFAFTSYFIGTTDSGASRSLYVRSIGAAPRELVENVEDMMVSFFVGHDLDTDVEDPKDGYVRAADVSDWGAVRNVEIQLLVRSPELVLPFEQAFPFDGETYTDRHHREVFATTVAFRPRNQWRVQ